MLEEDKPRKPDVKSVCGLSAELRELDPWVGGKLKEAVSRRKVRVDQQERGTRYVERQDTATSNIHVDEKPTGH